MTDHEEEEVVQTQPLTQLRDDPRRYGEPTGEFSDTDRTDIVCLLHPSTIAACTAVNKMHERDSKLTLEEYDVSTEATTGGRVVDDVGTFDLAANGLVSHEIVLRFSTPQKSEGEGWVLGRNPKSCDFVIDNAKLSNRHCRLYLNEFGILLLEDVSSNGTLIDNKLLGSKKGYNKTRTVLNGSVIDLLHTSTNPDSMIKFVVRIPTREGDDEHRYTRNLNAYLAKHYPKSYAAIEHATTQAEEAAEVPGAPDIFGEQKKKPQTRRTHSWRGGTNYNKQEKIGKGAFATVYRVTLKTDGTEYAAKEIYKKKFTRDGVLSPKIHNELDIMKRLRHPNIVQFIEHFELPDKLYLIMELVPGGDLRGQIEQGNLLTEGGTMLLTVQMLGALKRIHQDGIAHRDIKPDNIMIKSLEPLIGKLTDFGLSKRLVEGDGNVFESFCGTLLYLAPEVYPESREYDFSTGVRTRDRAKDLPAIAYTSKVDVWSLGCVLFHAVTGLPPYPATEAQNTGYLALLKTILTCPFPLEKLSARNFTVGAVDFVSRMLAKKPAERCSVVELLRDPWLGAARKHYSAQVGNISDVLDASDMEPFEMTGFDWYEDNVEIAEDLAQNASQLSIYDGKENASDFSDEGDELDLVPHENHALVSKQSSDEFLDEDDALDDSAFLEAVVATGGRLFGELRSDRAGFGGGFPDSDYNLAVQSSNVHPRQHNLGNTFDISNGGSFVHSSQSRPSHSYDDSESMQGIAHNNTHALHMIPQNAESLLGTESLVGNMQVASPAQHAVQAEDSILMPPPQPQAGARISLAATSANVPSHAASSRRRPAPETSPGKTSDRGRKRPATARTISRASMAQPQGNFAVPSIERQKSTLSASSEASTTSDRSTRSTRSTRSIKTIVIPQLFWDPRDASTHKFDTYGITGDEIHDMLDEAKARGVNFFSNSPVFFNIRDDVRKRGANGTRGNLGTTTLVETSHGRPDRHVIKDNAKTRISIEEATDYGTEKQPILEEKLGSQWLTTLSAEQLLRGERDPRVLFSKSWVKDKTPTPTEMDDGPAECSKTPAVKDDSVEDSTDRIEYAKLTTTDDSEMQYCELRITDLVTVWGRGKYTNPTYFRKHAISVPRYAFKLVLWAPGMVEGNMDISQARFYIGSKASSGVVVNTTNVPTTPQDATLEPFTPCTHWAELQRGDQITFFKAKVGSGSLSNTFVFDTDIGLSCVPRASAGDPVRLLPVGPQQEILDEWVLGEQRKMRDFHDTHRGQPGFLDGLERAFIQAETRALQEQQRRLSSATE